MITFEHKLPAMNIEGRHNGTYNNRELGLPSVLTTTDPRLGLFLHTLQGAIYAERSLVFIDDRILHCNLNWIRDHVHVMKAMVHWGSHLETFLNFIIDTQREDGQFYELIKQYDDYHWQFVNEDCRVMYPEDNLSLVRLELEADIEYLVVEGAMYLYRTTGDNVWLEKVLPRLEKAIDYMTSNEKRWDKEHGLVKRPFTIDTWDFAYGIPSNNRRIEATTPMSIMHGDNSGVYQAMNQLAWFNRRLNREAKAQEWEQRAETLRSNMFKYLWNGKFFIHQLHLDHAGADDLEHVRLSLSNPYDINRGVTDTEQSRKIIEEYMDRKQKLTGAAENPASSVPLYEWFSIDPPYAEFNGRTPGDYVNGAISPFTAGELAKAAFENGYEEYGWNIVSRFIDLVERDGNTYFLYYPDLTPQPQGGPSAWGAAAFVSAVDEGLAGIRDLGVNYDEIRFSPRFPVTHYTELRYFTGYEVTSTKVEVRYILKEEGMRYDLYSPAQNVQAHILLPKDKTCRQVFLNGTPVTYQEVCVGDSHYIDFETPADGYLSIEILF